MILLQRIVTPLEVAVESMQDVNKQLMELITAAEQADVKDMRPLEARLSGMLSWFF